MNASICNEISSVRQAQEFDSIGSDVLVLDRDINRDFQLLKKIRECTKKELKVLCNSLCVYQCINVQYHAAFSSFLSNEHLLSENQGEYDKQPFCSLYCRMKRFSDPVEYIKSQWIRPEDMRYYARIGIREFKIDGRDKKAEYVINTVTAYLLQKFEGNLFSLMQSKYPDSLDKCKNTVCQDVDSEWLIGMDNTLLDGYLMPFVKEEIICKGDCEKCGYCERWIGEMVINQRWREMMCRKLQKNIENNLC